MILAPNIPMARAVKENVESPAPQPPSTITTREVGYQHVDLAWTSNDTGLDQPCVMQRKTSGSFSAPVIGNAQDITSNFIWIGVNSPEGDADRYVDLGLAESTTYQYRVACITNWEDVVRDGDAETYTEWQYGEATTTAYPYATYNAVTTYGADNTGATNSWDEILAAVDAAKAAGGGKIYLPAGTYKIYPTDPDVLFNGTNLTVVNGQGFSGAFLRGDTSNIELYGDVDGGGDPSTFINCRLWHDRPATEYLTVLKAAGGDPTNDNDIYQGSSGTAPTAGIKRYGFWLCSDPNINVHDTVMRNLEVDMTAVPATTGNDWYSLDDLRYQWDISQKLMYGFWNAKNVLLDNVVAKNIRGEIAYSGGFGFQKFKMVDCVFSQSNSSIVSMSADCEIENSTFSDFSNSGIESNPHSRSGDDNAALLVSPYNGLSFRQDTIVRGCTFKCLDQSANGVMKLLDVDSYTNSFSGLHIFNQKGTIQTVTDTTIEDFRVTAIAPWYECYNSFMDSVTVDNPVWSNAAFIYLNPTPNPLYKLSGGMDYCYWGNLTFDMNSYTLSNGGNIFLNYSTMSAQDNVTIDKLDIIGSGTVPVLWRDQYNSATGRSNFRCRDWTETGLSNTPFGTFTNISSPSSNLALPYYEDVDVLTNEQVISEANGNLRVYWEHTQIENWEADNAYDVTGISTIDQHPVGSTLRFSPRNGSDTITFNADSSWNTFTQNYTITSTEVLTCSVVSVGTNKLQFVSKV